MLLYYLLHLIYNQQHKYSHLSCCLQNHYCQSFHRQEIVFSSVDMVNSQEENKTSRVYVDNTPPEIFINFSLDNIGTEDDLPVYPNYVRMFIGATDEKTGTKSIKYSIDGGPMTEYSSPRTLDISEKNTFTESKVYDVMVETEDMLGNTSTKEHKFIVKN